MGILGKLFGSEDVIKKAADGVYNGIDMAFHTDEERAQHFLKLLKAYEPFKIAQRLLALVVSIPYVTLWLLAALMIVGGSIAESQAIINGGKLLGELNNDALGMPVSLVLAFYFGGGAVEGVVRARMEK